VTGKHRPCGFEFAGGHPCCFVAGHIGEHITRAEFIELRRETRPQKGTT